ncbi:MAG: hypothetical protein LBS65_09650 [Desulfovibrio sp.]|nr:hypothetical protein [Desulfovibrio sp.]
MLEWDNETAFSFNPGKAVSIGDRLARGILIGGAVGALYVVFGYGSNMFLAVGAGALAGFLAGLTRAILDKRRKDDKPD